MSARHPEPILHVDMDAFFASVEQRDDPSLAGRPVAVGGAGERGVVAAASYEARAFGVRSAQPMAIARRRCPELVVVPARIGVYRRISAAVMSILHDVTPLVDPLSLDEAFLDVAGAVTLFGSPTRIGAAIRTRVRDELALGCSVGVGPTRSVAKLLSGRAKPDGLLHWPATEVERRLRPLPVGALWGVGPVLDERLEAAGIHTVGDVVDLDPLLLDRLVGVRTAQRLRDLARGIDLRPVGPGPARRTVSAETTFAQDVVDPAGVERHLRRVATKVARRLRAADLLARTVTVKVRDTDFVTRTRAHTGHPTHASGEIVDRALALLASSGLVGRPIRLVGVAAGGLEPAGGEQLSLEMDEAVRRRARLDRITDEAARRYGDTALGPAALVRPRRRS
jgi:DNA polymerase IV